MPYTVDNQYFFLSFYRSSLSDSAASFNGRPQLRAEVNGYYPKRNATGLRHLNRKLQA